MRPFAIARAVGAVALVMVMAAMAGSGWGAPSFPGGPQRVAAAPSLQQSCEVGTQLVANPGFDAPDIAANTDVRFQSASGTVWATDSFRTMLQDVEGRQSVTTGGGNLTQTVNLSGLAGAEITLSVTHLFGGAVTLGDFYAYTIPGTSPPFRTHSDTFIVPRGLGSVTLRVGSGPDLELDNVTLTVTNCRPPNVAPVAENDTYRVPVGQTLVVAAADGILANDTDGNFDVLTAVYVTLPAAGTVAIARYFPDGSFELTPWPDATGPITFTYQADDGIALSNVATVTIEVVTNEVPVANGDGPLAATEDTDLPIAAATLLGNDTDGDTGDTLSIGDYEQPLNGQLSPGPDGSLIYRPGQDYSGDDSFTYRAFDGTDFSAPATVTISVTAVNDPPAISPVDPQTVEEDGTLDGLFFVSDVESDPLTYGLAVDGGPTNGSATVYDAGFSGGFTYTPAPDFTGEDAFTIAVSDGVNTSTVVVTVTVTPVADPPVANPDGYVLDEDQPLVVSSRAEGVLGNDTDGDAGQQAVLTARVVEGPQHGGLVLQPDGQFTYTPSPDYNGADRFTYTANDGTTDSEVATVTLDIRAINDAPVIDAASVPAPIRASQATAAGTEVTFPLPTATDIDGDAVTVTCSPPSGFRFPFGTTTVTCTADDGSRAPNATARVRFTVTVVDTDRPSFDGGLTDRTVPATDASGAVVTYLLPTASDAVDSSVTVTCSPGSGTLFALGRTTVQCTAADDAGNQATGSFVVTVADQGQPRFTGGLTDRTVGSSDGSGAVVTYTTPTATDDVDASVTVRCDPPSGSRFAPGTTTVTCTATDDANNVATGRFNVTVTDQSAPVFTSLPNVTAAATGPSGAMVTYALPTATDNGGAPTVTCVPPSGSRFAIGVTTVTCTATDGANNRTTGTFTVTVTDQSAPVFTNIPNVTVGATSNYGAVVTYALPTATDNVGATVVCTPPPGSQFPIGTTTVACTASDGLTVTQGSFTVTVTNNGFRDPRDTRPGASPQTQPNLPASPRPTRPARPAR